MNFELVEWNGDELRKKIVSVSRNKVRAAAERVRKGAYKRAPVDTGGYRESIESRLWETSDSVGAYIEAGEKGMEHISNFIELGTPGDIYTGGAYKGQKRTPIPAKPHLRPALRAEEKRFINSFKDAL